MPSIKNLIADDAELVRLLPLMGSVTLIEYDGLNVQNIISLHEYMRQQGIKREVVKRIVLCGSRSSGITENAQRLKGLFPMAEIMRTHHTWRNTNFETLRASSPLVIHFASGVIESTLLKQIVEQTTYAYSVTFFFEAQPSLFATHQYDVTFMQTSLHIAPIDCTPAQQNQPTQVCRERQEYLQMYRQTVTGKDIVNQYLMEMSNGCEQCNQCTNYGVHRQCPMAQQMLSDCYRQGHFVPRSERIAHELSRKAALQGYAPAKIQMADDMAAGCGCTKDTEGTLAVYERMAQRGDHDCMRRIVAMADETPTAGGISVLPYMARLAADGDEDMALRLSDIFRLGQYGMPCDRVQQEEWIRQGAENGSPRQMRAMAEIGETYEDWSNAYTWYKRLMAVENSEELKEKMESVELKMLTEGIADDDIAQHGMNLLYGYHGVQRDVPLALRCLQYGHKEHKALATGLLGSMYLDGIGVAQDTAKGTDLTIEAANCGDLLSMNRLVEMHYAGTSYNAEWLHRIRNIIIEKKDDNAIACYLYALYHRAGKVFLEEISHEEISSVMMMAATMDYPPAQYELSRMYADGYGVVQDDEEYRCWLAKSADNGYGIAEGEYGMLLFDNNSKGTAFRYLKDAAEKGITDRAVRWRLAQCYINGYGTRIDKAHAYPLYREAAEAGIAEAQRQLCLDCFNGNAYVKQSYEECALWGERAMQQGCKDIRFETAYSLSHIGSHDKARTIYLELANEGNAAAMNNYACELSDIAARAEWFQKAADAGDSYGLWNLGKLNLDGRGVEQNIAKGLELIRRGAAAGCHGAMTDLAYTYRYGKNVAIDGAEAEKWYMKAIDAGHHENLIELAKMFLDGKAVEQDVQRALHHLNDAVERGIDNALVELGKIYENGTGVDKDTDKAIYYYRRAAGKGNNEAKRRLHNLETNWVENGRVENTFDDNDDLPF